jgi:hypothetical protein
MERAIRSIRWKRPEAESATDVTDAVEEAVLSATPHPDDDVDEPKGYSVKLRLKPGSSAFAEDIQEALMNFETAEVTIRLDGVDEPIANVPVGVSKMPHLGEQNAAEFGVKPEGHERLHPYF